LDESTGVFDISKGSITRSSSSFRDNSKRVSFFGRLNYIFKKKHIVTATFRADGSDKFGPGNRYGYFPSFAYTWLMIDEGFMQSQSLLTNAKVRGSYGICGNDRIPSHSYLPRLENTYYNGELGLAASSLANELLKWETTNQANIGTDLGFLDNALTLTVDLYAKQTQNMLIPTPVAGQTGYTQQWKNIGRVDNKGIEFQFSSRNIDKKDFKWITNFNISHNNNTVVDLGIIDFIPVIIPGGWIQDIGRVNVGRPLGEAYGYVFDGIYQLSDFNWQNGSDVNIPHKDRIYVLNDGVVSVTGINVKPGSHKFADIDGDNEINLDDDRRPISTSQPLFFFGITNKFQYRNFDLNLFFQGSYGNEIFNESKFRLEGGILHAYMNISKEFYDNHWTLDNPSVTHGDYADRNPTAYLASDYYVEDASYIKLSSLSLGYTLRSKTLATLNLSSVRIYVTGNNLYTFTNYSGFDPEVNTGNILLGGVDRISYPRAKIFMFGVNVEF
jgi:TonB-linked SusC/RagA family outer membrane protein